MKSHCFLTNLFHLTIINDLEGMCIFSCVMGKYYKMGCYCVSLANSTLSGAHGGSLGLATAGVFTLKECLHRRLAKAAGRASQPPHPEKQLLKIYQHANDHDPGQVTGT